jgi:NADPH:quinone reductase
MRAVEITRPGGPEVLKVVERPKPVPKADEVLIAVKAAGVTRADTHQRRGAYPPPPDAPDIPGMEVAGIIEETGERVCALIPGGGYAEYAAAPRDNTLPIPENWNFVEAASLPENMFTAWDNVFTRARFGEGQSILIHGGSSGVGTTTIMLAKAFGASFIAVTAGNDEKCKACLELGAGLAINYKKQDFVAETQRATGGRGVDVILDMVGGDYIPRNLDTLALDGRMTCIATTAGRTVQIDLVKLMQRRCAIMASAMRSRTVKEKAAIARDLLANVWPLLPARNPIYPVIDSVYQFEDAAQAHRRMESSQHIGKIVLEV